MYITCYGLPHQIKSSGRSSLSFEEISLESCVWYVKPEFAQWKELQVHFLSE